MTERLPLCGVKERTGATEGLNWQEGADDGKMMNKYPAEQYCGCLLTAASKPVVLHFFESIHFNIKISLWAIQHFLAIQLCSSRFMAVGVDGDILYICHSWDLWYPHRPTSAVLLWEEMQVCSRSIPVVSPDAESLHRCTAEITTPGQGGCQWGAPPRALQALFVVPYLGTGAGAE